MLPLAGEQRFHSVQNALQFIPADEGAIVAVHDAARPNIDLEFLQQLENEVVGKGNAIPALPVSDSLRMRKGDLWCAVHRDDYRIIQTPQCFNAALLKKAYLQEYTASFTDDASVLEADGNEIHLVHGKNGNIKITHAEDLKWMSFLMSDKA
jgi:2-C-methyl-D-erythritol 4-phosphate cytidylyltransferase